MKTKKQNYKILSFEYLTNTASGNPRCLLGIEDKNGETFTATTKTNAAVAYFLGGWAVGKILELETYNTKSGGLKIQNAKKINNKGI